MKLQKSYRKTARLRLQEMYRDGFNSKRSTDKTNADTRNKIYSKNTFETYKRQFRYFAEWLSEAHSDALTLADARGMQMSTFFIWLNQSVLRTV